MTTSQPFSDKSGLSLSYKSQHDILILIAFVVNSVNVVMQDQDHITRLIISCVHVTRLLANDKVLGVTIC